MRANGAFVFMVALGILRWPGIAPTASVSLSPPQVESVTASSTFDRVVVVFNEVVDSTSATDVFNYVLLDGQQHGLMLLWAEIAQDGRTVTLFLEPPAALQAGQWYTLTVTGVKDIAGHENSPVTVPFQSFLEGCGGMIFEAFWQREINVISPPLGSYPELYYRTNIPAFDSRLAFPENRNGLYEGRMRGVFVPPFSGRWIFYLRSDMQSRLWINPYGVDPAGKRLVQEESGCCRAFEALPTEPFSLIAGRAYYVESLHRQWFGSGYCQVAARIEGSTEPLQPIVLRDLGQFALPDAAGPITILRQPEDQAVLENRLVTMTVEATNDYNGPICYQWMKDGVEIVGANGASYSLRPSACDFYQAAFSVRLSIPGQTVFSGEGVLTVDEDASPPQVIGVRGSEDLRQIHVQFDDRVTESSAGDVFNYAVTNATGSRLEVEYAVRNPDGTSAMLSTALQQPGVLYTVTVNGVSDIACRPHLIWEGKASFTASMLVARAALSSNVLSLSWSSRTGGVYRIHWTDDLTSNWVAFPGDIVGAGTNTIVTQRLNGGAPTGFYRIQVVDWP